MNELAIISVLIFTATLLAVNAAYRFFFFVRPMRRSADRRLAQSNPPAHRVEALQALRSASGIARLNSPFLNRAYFLLKQTGLTVDWKQFLLSALVFVTILFLIWGFFLGFGITALAAASLCTFVLILFFLKIARQRRVARFAELLPDSIDIIMRGIRVGYPLPAALDLVAREMPDPIGAEFRITADEIAFGQDVKSAIGNLHRRVGQDDLLFLIMAINVQSQTGGNLADILTGLSRMLRNRAKLNMKIKALTADGRLSAIVLSLLPFILFGVTYLLSPTYFSEVRVHPIAVPALIYAALSLVVGNVIMYRMVNFKF